MFWLLPCPVLTTYLPQPHHVTYLAPPPTPTRAAVRTLPRTRTHARTHRTFGHANMLVRYAARTRYLQHFYGFILLPPHRPLQLHTHLPFAFERLHSALQVTHLLPALRTPLTLGHVAPHADGLYVPRIWDAATAAFVTPTT